MRRKIGNACMMLGAVLVLAALFLFLCNRNEDARAGAAAESILPQVVEQIKAEPDGGEGETPALPDPYDSEMAEAEIDGYSYIGYISVPAIELELPVMSEWDYDRLKIAPCRYYGSAKTDDLVIVAHNYKRHFGSIKNLTAGDAVYFTDMDGVVYAYEVVSLEILPPTAVEEMTSGGFDLTLFTCTYGGADRVTVRCSEVTD